MEILEKYVWASYKGIPLFHVSLSQEGETSVSHAIKNCLTARFRMVFADVDEYFPLLSVHDIFKRIGLGIHPETALQILCSVGVFPQKHVLGRVMLQPEVMSAPPLTSLYTPVDHLMPFEPPINPNLLHRSYVIRNYKVYDPSIPFEVDLAIKDLRENGPLLAALRVAPDYMEDADRRIFRSEVPIHGWVRDDYHVVCIAGFYRYETEIVWVYLNSYGVDFGSNGFGLMPNKYFYSMYSPTVDTEL